MENLDLKKYLCELFESHEVPFEMHNEWIVPHSRLPAIRATWYPKENRGVFQVEVLLEDNRILNECFVGSGSDKEGILSGLENFCINSFHVMLSAFWSTHDSNQVENEQWNIGGKEYQIYIGNFGTRATVGDKAVIPQGLFEAIEKAILSGSINNDISWYRVFIGSNSGDFTFEALQNNEDWPEGLSAIKDLPWENSEGYYSVRNFIIVKSKTINIS